MARITASQNGIDLDQLRDYDAYLVQLKEIGWSNGAPQYGGEKRLEVTWERVDGVGNGTEETFRDWLSLRLGRQQSGQVSKLRMLLNALAGQPETVDIAWFEDEELTWSYDGQNPYARLSEGLQVVVRGKVELKADGSGRRFRITTYQPAGPAPPEPASADPHEPVGQPPLPAAEVADSEVPF